MRTDELFILSHFPVTIRAQGHQSLQTQIHACGLLISPHCSLRYEWDHVGNNPVDDRKATIHWQFSRVRDQGRRGLREQATRMT